MHQGAGEKLRWHPDRKRCYFFASSGAGGGTTTTVLPDFPGAPGAPSGPGAPAAPGGPGTGVGTVTTAGAGAGVGTGTGCTTVSVFSVFWQAPNPTVAATVAAANIEYFIIVSLSFLGSHGALSRIRTYDTLGRRRWSN